MTPSTDFTVGGSTSNSSNTNSETTFTQEDEVETPAGTFDAVFTWSLNAVGSWSWRVSLYKNNTHGSPVCSQVKDLHEAPDEILEQLLAVYEDKHDAKQEELTQKKDEVDSLKKKLDCISAALNDK